MKCKISIDEKWPIFSLENLRYENDPFVVEINEEFYKEYCYFMSKYEEYQSRIRVIYEQQKLAFNEQNVGYRFPKDTIVDTEFRINSLQPVNITEEKV